MSRVAQFVPVGLALMGVVQLLTGVVMLADARFFYDHVAEFPPANGHFIRDIGTFEVAYGGALLWAVRAPSWRMPLIVLGLIQYVLHAVNHLLDIDVAATDSVGITNFALIAGGAVIFVVLLLGERRRVAA